MKETALSCEVEEPPGGVTEPLFREGTPNNVIPQKKLGNSKKIHQNKKLVKKKSDNDRNNPSLKSCTQFFQKRYFPQASKAQWNDWHWQLRNRICTLEQIQRMFHLSKDEHSFFFQHKEHFPVSITPYYASLMNEKNENDPLRKAMIPTSAEKIKSPEESLDPLAEKEQTPIHGIVHRYPDRVLFLVTNLCACYCRYCTRSRIVGQHKQENVFTKHTWEKCIQYIKSNTKIIDVLLSGGDPLLLGNESLQWLLTSLREIKHVKIIRIGTKAPVVLPQRITPSLISMLKRYHPIWMSIHFTHPKELTYEVRKACGMLADSGIPLGSQTVLLSGINDNVNTLKNLFNGLLTLRIRPYYLYQCDPIIGSAHFRTPVQKGIDIIRNLRGFISGYALPNFVIDAPGGGGKIPIAPEYIVGREGNDIVLKNFEGKIYRYPDNLHGRYRISDN